MPLTDIHRDLAAGTLTTTSSLAATVERAWQLWADPRQLERWWGPPSHPGTVVEHDLRPGGAVTYFMTGPDGDRHHGYWRIEEVQPPHRLVFTDGFADNDGRPVESLPTSRAVVELVDAGDGTTTMTVTSTFASPEALQQVLDMGVEEGIRGSLGQVDDLLRDTARAS